jgi:hypothetical protein
VCPNQSNATGKYPPDLPYQGCDISLPISAAVCLCALVPGSMQHSDLPDTLLHRRDVLDFKADVFRRFYS